MTDAYVQEMRRGLIGNLCPSAVVHDTVGFGDNTDWLAWRTKGLGASDVAAALGVSPYDTPLSLYSRKLGLLPPVEETDAMAFGKAVESAILSLYERRTGREALAFQVCLESRIHPFLRATLDACTRDGRVLEVKNAGWRMADQWGEEGSDEIPIQYLCQVHAQLLVSGADVAEVAVLIGGSDFRIYQVQADPDVNSMLADKLGEFWSRIERRDPPPASMPADAEVIARIRPADLATIDLDLDALDLAMAYDTLGADIKANEEARSIVKAQLIEKMNGHAYASLPDGRTISRKIVERAGYEVKATSYTTFQISKPKRARV